jgi:hypothetical protein
MNLALPLILAEVLAEPPCLPHLLGCSKQSKIADSLLQGVCDFPETMSLNFVICE